jgi:hypothetical protein
MLPPGTGTSSTDVSRHAITPTFWHDSPTPASVAPHHTEVPTAIAPHRKSTSPSEQVTQEEAAEQGGPREAATTGQPPTFALSSVVMVLVENISTFSFILIHK